MTVPVLGPVSMTGFQHGWYFLYALVCVAALVGYVADMFGPRWALGVAALSGILSVATSIAGLPELPAKV